ncbi:recombinase family protein [Leucobacter sp. HY1910]
MNARLRPVPATAPRAVLYLRQSVARDDSISIELQRIAGEDYCTKHGYEVVAVEVDEGISGRKWSTRPAVQRTMRMIEDGSADIIVLWKWSRLSRSRTDWALAADRVDVAGGRIESATEPIDTATASGRFARGVMTEYAAFQSEQIGEQWAEAHRRRFNLGLPPSGPIPWGWTSHKSHITVDPERAEVIRGMYRLYFEGRGFAYIASWLNSQSYAAPRGGKWGSVSVKGCMDSHIHAGKVEYRGEIRDGAHEGIISELEHARYLKLRGARHIPKKPRSSVYLLSTLVKCHCGFKRAGSVSRSQWGDRKKRYYSYLCPQVGPHPRKSMITWRVDGAVLAWVRSLDVTATDASSGGHEVAQYARELIAIEKRLDKLTEHLLSGLVPEATYARTRDQLDTVARAARANLAEAERERGLTPEVLLGGNVALLDRLETLPVEDQQSVLRSLIDVVVIRADDMLEIHAHWGGEPAVVPLVAK